MTMIIAQREFGCQAKNSVVADNVPGTAASFDFKVIPSLNKTLVLELARCEYIERRENLIALGNSGTGKTHIALGLGLAACQKGLSVGFITAAALVHELIEARDDKQLLRFQKKLATYKLLIVDELGFVPLSKTGAELLFEVFSQRYERGSTLATTNLPFDEWTEVFGSERLTGALLDRLILGALEGHRVDALDLQGLHEAFHHGVVIGVSLRSLARSLVHHVLLCAFRRAQEEAVR